MFIHVQSMRFMCCFNMGFNLTRLGKKALICLSDITLESVAAQTDHYINVFVYKNVWLYPRYEVYRGYIVFAFSVIMFVCLSVCWFVCKLFFSSKISQQLLGLGF